MGNRIRMLVDNATLDAILRWEPEVRSRFARRTASRQFVIYLAPETVAEMFSIGATSRAEKLSSLAELTLKIFNGQMLNYYFWRILDEVRGRPTSPFLTAGMTRRFLENIRHFATGGTPHDPEWFRHGADIIRREKADDERWRTGFQEMYRSRDRQNEPNLAGRPFDEFAKTRTVRDLVLSRVEAICAYAAVADSSIRASAIVDGGFARCPALAAHVFVRIARLWWYTESTRDGRRASADLFDDALLNYITELDMIVTPDRALIDFGRTAFPEKQFLSPDAFREQCLNSA